MENSLRTPGGVVDHVPKVPSSNKADNENSREAERQRFRMRTEREWEA